MLGQDRHRQQPGCDARKYRLRCARPTARDHQAGEWDENGGDHRAANSTGERVGQQQQHDPRRHAPDVIGPLLPWSGSDRLRVCAQLPPVESESHGKGRGERQNAPGRVAGDRERCDDEHGNAGQPRLSTACRDEMGRQGARPIPLAALGRFKGPHVYALRKIRAGLLGRFHRDASIGARLRSVGTAGSCSRDLCDIPTSRALLPSPRPSSARPVPGVQSAASAVRRPRTASG